MPRLSVILPVHNGADTLDEALESVLCQSFGDFELLIYNDGSSDYTSDIIDKFARLDNRVRLVGESRVGLVEALRLLGMAATGGFLARMDADDRCYLERFKQQVAYLDVHPSVALVSCLVRCFPAEDLAFGMQHYESWLNSLVTPEQIAKDIFVESPLCHPSVIMRRDSYEKVGGYIDDGNPEDYGLWLRFFEHKLKMAKVEQALFEWREGGGRLTRTDPRYDKDRFMELKLRHLLKGPLKDIRKIVICGTGKHGRSWSRLLTASDREVVAFVDVNPKGQGRKLHGAPVIAPKDLRVNSNDTHVLAAVGLPGVREKIREFLVGKGLTEQRDFTCVA